jgi:drug/metabolite transporter (DMT)-like permease
VSRGVIDMALATLAFTAMNAFVKAGGALLGPVELVFWRSLLGALLVLPLALHNRNVRMTSPGLMLARTLFGVTAMSLGFASLKGLTLAEAALIFELQPVLVAVLAPVVFGEHEKVGRGVWSAMGLGCAGGAIILAPDALSGSVWGLLALLSAVASAGAHLCLRPLGRDEDSRAIVLWFLAGSAVVSAVVAPLQDGRPIDLTPDAGWPVLAGLAASATAGQLLMTRAYQRERAGIVAATQYVAPLLAAVVDAAVFRVLPGWNAWLGGVLVVLAGLTLLLGGLPTPARIAALRRPQPVAS